MCLLSEVKDKIPFVLHRSSRKPQDRQVPSQKVVVVGSGLTYTATLSECPRDNPCNSCNGIGPLKGRVRFSYHLTPAKLLVGVRYARSRLQNLGDTSCTSTLTNIVARRQESSRALSGLTRQITRRCAQSHQGWHQPQVGRGIVELFRIRRVSHEDSNRRAVDGVIPMSTKIVSILPVLP